MAVSLGILRAWKARASTSPQMTPRCTTSLLGDDAWRA